ncbi:ribonuclease J [[Mycoplasma] testudinis]|uniref:ribonuclease J n=1 Tax=[Mycoplasma] testudinis TaxID=33924 RepID=UPI000481B07E|nr:ribonuclease J [[Mycoplasma] testudinis]
MSKVNFFALGGQDERGKNCSVLEIGDDLFIFNSGTLVPTTSLLGVKQLIPDFDWLLKNKKRIRGIMIGYPTYDNIGALEYLFQALGSIPIYTSIIGKTVIETIIEKKTQNMSGKNIKIVVLDAMEYFKIGNVEVLPFKVCSSMPWSYGFAFKTKDGHVVYIDDFITINDKNFAFESQLNDLVAKIGTNILLLIVAVGAVGKNTGFTAPNHKSKAILERIVSSAKGRVFIACYDSNAYTILTAGQLARQKQRPFIIYSHTFINIFVATIRNKIFNNRNLLTLPIGEIDKSDNAIICITSNPYRLYAKLSKIANNEDEKIHYNQKDTFVFITPRVAGYEAVEARILDDVARHDVNYFKLTNEVFPMQASDEDHKHLLNLLKPKYVIPISGLYKDFLKYTAVAKHTGISTEQVKILYNGEIISILNGTINKGAKEISLQEKCVDSAGIQDVGASILFEREQMAENGVITIALFYNAKTGKFLKEFKSNILGISDDSKKMAEVEEKMEHYIRLSIADLEKIKSKSENFKIGMSEMREFKINMKKGITKLFEKSVDKKPIILPTIIDL